MFLDTLRQLFSKPSTTVQSEQAPVAAPRQPVVDTPEKAPMATPRQPVAASERHVDRPASTPVDRPATAPVDHSSSTSADHQPELMKKAAPPTYISRNVSWRGPDTQIGRMVKTIEQNCPDLGMHPADYEILADWCSMGHIPSMRRMMQHFDSLISPEGKEHLHRYLTADADGQSDWDAFLTENEIDCFNIRAYGFWLCRLADFGDEEASAIVDATPDIRNVAFMGGMRKEGPTMHAVSTKPIIDPRFANIFYYPGKIDSLRMGLLDVYKANGAILSWSESDKVYTGDNYAGDSGFDETGFGMEEEYDYFFFDEYFRLLRVLYGWSHHDMRVNEERLRKEREEKRKEYESEREAFMKAHGKEGAPVA